MDSDSSVVCPVCTLYLRPGITLKTHLGSHPKQKVIEALVRLAAETPNTTAGKELVVNKNNELIEYSEDGNGHHAGNNTAVLGQQWAPSGPIGLNSATFAPIPGNHSIIYQQFVTSAAAAAAAAAASTSNHHNLLQLQHHHHQQQPYVIFNSTGQQHHHGHHPAAAAASAGASAQQNQLAAAPYVFHQQQQLIMSSTSTAAAPGSLGSAGVLQTGHQLQMLPSTAATGTMAHSNDHRLMTATVIGRNQHQQQLIALLPQPEKLMKTIFEVNVVEEEDVLDEPDIATLENDGPASVCVTVSTPSENRSDIELKTSTMHNVTENIDMIDSNVLHSPLQRHSPSNMVSNQLMDNNEAVDLSQQSMPEDINMQTIEIEMQEEASQQMSDDIRRHEVPKQENELDIKCHSPNIDQVYTEIENDYDSSKGASDNEYEEEDCMSPKSESSEFLKIRNDLNNTSKETQTCSDMGTDGGESSQPRSLNLNPPTAFYISEENTTGINVECSEYITLQNSNAATEQGLYCNREDTSDDKEDGQNGNTIDMDGMNLVINNDFLHAHGLSNIENNFEYAASISKTSAVHHSLSSNVTSTITSHILPQTTSVLRSMSPACSVAQPLHLLQHNPTIIATTTNNQTSTIVRASPILTAPNNTLTSVTAGGTLTHTTNIRSDERMPPRGELSGQESSNASDVSAWIQMAQYREDQDAPGLLGIYSRNAGQWDDSPDSSDCEDERARPLPTQKQRYTSTIIQPIMSSTVIAEVPSVAMDAEDYVDDTPTVSGYSDPPIQYKCPNCPQVFSCQTERRTHQRLMHSDSNSTGCLIMNGVLPLLSTISESESGINNGYLPVTAAKKSVKKLQIKPKPKSHPLKEVKAETNFDNVFTNKLKMEMDDVDITPTLTASLSHLKHELDPSAKLSSATTITTVNHLSIVPPSPIQLLLKQDDVKIVSTCLLCNVSFPDTEKYKEHLAMVHADITASLIGVLPPNSVGAVTVPTAKHKCAMCGELFPTEAKYTLHLKIHPLECRYCGRYFYRRANLQLHHKRHLGIKPHKCAICEKCFLTKQKLEEHTNVHTGQNPIKCTLCGESFRRHSNLVQHKNKHHLKIKPKVKDFICDCGLIFHSAKKLAWHSETHDKQPKACTQCSEKFVHAASLTRHMRRAHNDRFVPHMKRNDENVECPICKGIYLRASLEVHIKNHSGARPFMCPICNKDFTTKWNLKLHKWTHAARISKPFKCDKCKGAFVRESDYIAHMNSHKALRPYTCNYCGAQFIRKYNCQRHVKEHEKDKTYTCEICNKTFHRSYYLKDHMRVHSGARPFACHICGKGSTTKSNHNKHVRIHHAREPISTEN